jgi:hypothetical protein
LRFFGLVSWLWRFCSSLGLVGRRRVCWIRICVGLGGDLWRWRRRGGRDGIESGMLGMEDALRIRVLTTMERIFDFLRNFWLSCLTSQQDNCAAEISSPNHQKQSYGEYESVINEATVEIRLKCHGTALFPAFKSLSIMASVLRASTKFGPSERYNVRIRLELLPVRLHPASYRNHHGRFISYLTMKRASGLLASPSSPISSQNQQTFFQF